MTSQSHSGIWNVTALPQWPSVSEKQTAFVSRSYLVSAAKCPSILRGKRASPLLSEAAPTTGEASKEMKSSVLSSCCEMCVPSKAVYVAR